MTRSVRTALHCALLTATLALSASPAFAAPPGNAAPSPHPSTASSTRAWTPPAGFTREDSFFGGAAACEAAGGKGVAEGRWSAYVCVQGLPFTPFKDLYVKK
jgi:hypothetical protein